MKPNCGRRLHSGWGWRYYCDPYNKSWFSESDLPLNIDGGWVEKDRGQKVRYHGALL